MEGLPKTIYHYCPSEVFFSILNTKQLFLTSAYLTNDWQEVIWIGSTFRSVLIELWEKNPAFGHFFSHLWERRGIWSNLQGPTVTIPFVACFSEHPDMLSQWRAYAEDGLGFSIGFDPAEFEIEVITPTDLKADWQGRNRLGLARVIYSEADQSRWVQEVMKRHLSNTSLQDPISQIKEVVPCLTELFRLATFFKNPAFEEEREWRMIYVPSLGIDKGQLLQPVPRPNKICEIKFRHANNRFFAYYPLDLSRLSSVSDIRIGPRCLTDELTIRGYIAYTGFGHVTPTRSVASYRKF
jgi:hypothetical protein